MNQQAEAILHEMENLLQELISVAKKLCTTSQASLSKEDLATLQQRQKELMQQLVDADIAFTRVTKGQINSYDSPAKTSVNQLLSDFQELNSSFIESIQDSSGLIQFRKK